VEHCTVFPDSSSESLKMIQVTWLGHTSAQKEKESVAIYVYPKYKQFETELHQFISKNTEC
jgi:hypothetical protein